MLPRWEIQALQVSINPHSCISRRDVCSHFSDRQTEAPVKVGLHVLHIFGGRIGIQAALLAAVRCRTGRLVQRPAGSQT